MKALQIIWIGLSLALAACDPTAPLFIRNGLSSPITIRVQFSEGGIDDGILQPGQRMTFVHPPGDISRVMILVDERAIHDLDKTVLDKMQQSVPDPRSITWSVEPDGIKALSRAEWEKLRKDKMED